MANKATVTPEVNKPYDVAASNFKFGFVPSAEIWNGRLAMIGFVSAALVEVFSGQGFLHFWGLIGL